MVQVLNYVLFVCLLAFNLFKNIEHKTSGNAVSACKIAPRARYSIAIFLCCTWRSVTTTVTETGDGAIPEMVENKGKAKEKGKTKQKKS